MAEKKVNLEKVAESLNMSLDDFLAMGTTKAASLLKVMVSDAFETADAKNNQKYFDNGKDFIPKLRDYFKEPKIIVVSKIGQRSTPDRVPVVGFNSETSEVIVYKSGKLFSIPETDIIKSQDEYLNIKETGKKKGTGKGSKKIKDL
jgi:hypothetical protein